MLSVNCETLGNTEFNYQLFVGLTYSVICCYFQSWAVYSSLEWRWKYSVLKRKCFGDSARFTVKQTVKMKLFYYNQVIIAWFFSQCAMQHLLQISMNSAERSIKAQKFEESLFPTNCVVPRIRAQKFVGMNFFHIICWAFY